MERSPALAAGGHGARRLRRRRRARLRPHALASTRAPSRRSRPRSPRRARRAARRRHPRLRLRVRRHDRRGRRLLRRRRGDGAARLPAGPARHRLRAPAVPRRARRATACRPSSTTSRRSCNMPFIAARGAEAYRALSPGATPGSQARLLQRALRAARASTRCRFGMHDARAVRGRRRRPAWTGARSRRCRSAARSAGSCPASLLDTAFDFDAAGRRGLHGRPRRHRRLRRDAPTCATSPATCCASAPHESCGKCFPCRIGLRRAHEMFVDGEPVDRGRLEELLETLEVGEPVRARRRHAGADPQPARALPGGAGARMMHVDGRRQRGRGRAGRDGARGGARRRRHGADALLRRAPGAVRRLPRLPGRRRGRGTARSPACTTPVPRGHGRRHAATRRARRVAGAVVELVLSELPEAPAAHTELAEVARALGVGEPRWSGRRPPASVTTTRHPYLAFRHELCISCGRCVRACDEVQGTFALTATGRGFDANVAAGLDAGLPRLGMRLVRRVRGHLSDRRDHRDRRCSLCAEQAR